MHGNILLLKTLTRAILLLTSYGISIIKKNNPHIYFLSITQLLSQCFEVFLGVICTVLIFTEHQHLCEKGVTVHKDVFQPISMLVFIWSVSK